MNIKAMQKNHDALNAEYIADKAKMFTQEMFAEGTEENTKWKALAGTRLDKLVKTLDGISDAEIAAAPYVDALDLLVSFFDDVMLECAEIADRRAEIESKIVTTGAKVLAKPTAESTRNTETEHVTATIIDCISAVPSEIVSSTMAKAILDDTNPLRLGFTFYLNFCKENQTLVAAQALDYLVTEAGVRRNLIKGDHTSVLEGLEKLLACPFNCPEKYLLASLNSFHHGFDDDAKRIINLGLQAFPNNERLLSAQGAF
ncbi:MAG: hypothetical protein FWF79_07935 [Defluviitaleaceae bacterium]|nr:hypothetical protein [Defluviitaleaceae bacterium]